MTGLKQEPPPLDVDALARDAAPEATPSGLQRRKWFIGLLLSVDLVLLLIALSFAQISAEGPAMRGLRHSVAILSEIDAYLDERYEEIVQQSSEPDQPSITLDDLPAAPSVLAEEVTSTDRDGFRTLLLDRMAEQVYDEGSDVFREERDGSVDLFSSPGAVQRGMDLLRPGPHTAFITLTIALSFAALLLAAALLAATRGYGRLTALGASVSLAAGAVLVLAVLASFLFRIVADGAADNVAAEFLRLGRSMTWAPIRNSLILTILGLLTLASGAILGRAAGQQP